MGLFQFKKLSLLVFIIVPLLYACADVDESEEEVKQTPQESTLQINIAAQNKIEQEATKSLSTINTQGSFTFETQRMVTVELHFLTTQFQENISIYSSIDASSNTPVNLLEQGTINQSNSYKTMLTVATALSALIVVRNNDFSTLVAVEINSHDLLTHTFQE